MKKLLIVPLISSFIIACGGSDGSANADDNSQTLTQQQIEEKFNLPPEPNPEENNKTILGIDSNNNDIRDDWERAIAFEYYQEPTRMHLQNSLAKNSTQRTKAYQSGDVSQYQALSDHMIEVIGCAGSIYSNEMSFPNREIFKMGENTRERLMYILKRDREFVRVLGSGFHGLSPSEEKDRCAKYIK